MNDKRKMLTPKLRFPEFKDRPGWEEKALSDVCEVNPQSDGLPDSFVYIDLESVEGGLLLSRKRIERKDAPSRAQRLLKNGDVAFQIVRPYQRNNLFVDFNDGEAYVASTGYAQLRAYGSNSFLYQLVHTEPFVEKVIAKCTGSSYPAINSNDLAEVPVFVPQLSEQRKIAACLTWLDKWIAAEAQKMEALRAHKKGLMQQLFPREGETRPRRRFPGFRKEWPRVPLGAVAAEYRATSTVQDQHEVLTSARRGLMRQVDYYGEGRITERANMGFNIIPPDHITYRSRSDDGRFYFNRNSLGITGIISVYYPVFHSVEGSNAFLAAILNQVSVEISRQAVGTSQRVLPLSALFRFQIPVPNQDEQERIAACLTSFDALIAAQSRKLDGLRAHKKGLMQQLFPSPEEV